MMATDSPTVVTDSPTMATDSPTPSTTHAPTLSPTASPTLPEFEAAASVTNLQEQQHEEEKQSRTCCFGLSDLSIDSILVGRLNLTDQVRYSDTSSERTVAKITFPKDTFGPLSLLLSVDPSPRDVSVDIVCNSLTTTWLIGPPGDLRPPPSPHIPPPDFADPECPRLPIRLSADGPRVEVRGYFNSAPEVETASDNNTESYNKVYIVVGVFLILYIIFTYKYQKQKNNRRYDDRPAEEGEDEKSLDV
jgi:hypothetical protein